MIYLELFYSYLKIGFFGFGGGYAMLSLIQNEVVVQNGWMSNAEFADIVAVSQMTPGPIAINSATYVGYTVAGFWGSVVATVSVCLPALTLMIIITRFFLQLRDNRYVKGAVAGMRPVVIGMIGAAALLLIFPSSDDGASLHRRLSLGAFRRDARRIVQESQPHTTDRPLGRRGYGDISLDLLLVQQISATQDAVLLQFGLPYGADLVGRTALDYHAAHVIDTH